MTCYCCSGEIIQEETAEHPELGVGIITEGVEFPNVGNTYKLYDTALIQVFNLNAAIEFDLNNSEDQISWI